MADISLTICICTSGRPQELQRCLQSIAAGDKLPLEVIVSDDSRDPSVAAAIQEVCAIHDFIRYVEGPRGGLCANRNAVIRHTRGSHVSLLDDDALISKDFVSLALHLAKQEAHIIWTGDVFESDIRTPPTNPTWLGFFGRTPRKDEPLRNINLNCNVIPLRAFEVGRFDERIAYGYEDTDLCDQWIRNGWIIRHDSRLVNKHMPPKPTAMQIRQRAIEADVARIYVRIRGKVRAGHRGAAIAWLVAALGHQVAASVKRGRVPPLGRMIVAARVAMCVPDAPPAILPSHAMP